MGTIDKTPVLIDVLGNNFRLTDAAGGVNFDLDKDGIREQTAWTVAGVDDAFLVLDRNGNGTIDDGGELTPGRNYWTTFRGPRRDGNYEATPFYAQWTDSTSDGPRATPTWDQGRVYALGATGELRCLDANSGSVIKKILSDNQASNLQWPWLLHHSTTR